MPYVIITDSTCSLTKEEIKECDVKIIDLSFILKGKEYFSDDTENIKLFYDEMRKKENASTSCINVQGFVDVFEQELVKGNDILSISFSSALSATFANSESAKELLKEKYPDRKIICVDSLIASYGGGMLIYQAGILRKKGKSIEEVTDYLNNNKLKANALFTVDDLFYLYRGGRVKPSSYLLAKAINIKPLMHMDNFGRLVAYGKTLGRKKSLLSLIDKLILTIDNPKEQVIYISHGDCMDDVEFVVRQISKRIYVKGFKVTYIDPVIGVHSGPGTLALFYFAKSRV